MISSLLVPKNNGFPSNNSARTHPSDQISISGPNGTPNIT